MHEIGETMTKHLINFLLKSNFDFKKAMKNYKYYNEVLNVFVKSYFGGIT